MTELDLHLPHLDFQRDLSNRGAHSPSSFQSLLAQNEDLAARLRVTLQKMSQMEESTQQLMEQNQEIRLQYAAIEDQILVWKEKESMWRERESNLQQSFHEKSREFEIEASLLRQNSDKVADLEVKLDRLKRYQERVRTTVKPYVQKLKLYSQTLMEEIRGMHQKLMQKELEQQSQNEKIYALQAECESIHNRLENEKNQLVLIFEKDRADLRSEIKNMQHQNELLVEKTRHLDRSLERQDELENLVVALRRTKEDREREFNAQHSQILEDNSKLRGELAIKTVQTDDNQSELTRKIEQLRSLEGKFADNNEQLSSLRYMWTQKSQENEALKASLSSLEKLNLELSQKLNQTRGD